MNTAQVGRSWGVGVGRGHCSVQVFVEARLPFRLHPDEVITILHILLWIVLMEAQRSGVKGVRC